MEGEKREGGDEWRKGNGGGLTLFKSVLRQSYPESCAVAPLPRHRYESKPQSSCHPGPGYK